jgi:hypothetical protein
MKSNKLWLRDETGKLRLNPYFIDLVRVATDKHVGKSTNSSSIVSVTALAADIRDDPSLRAKFHPYLPGTNYRQTFYCILRRGLEENGATRWSDKAFLLNR